MTVSTRNRVPTLRFALNPFADRRTQEEFTTLVSGCQVFADMAEQMGQGRRHIT
ncbi:hypothetical protein [Streptomyces sp. NPDC046909]|uniref:hypothetical protein n=1 Tax=Streptomyces sp. NPDC046909 TaxID=3155617 RepID=UPI0033F4CAF3